ncbi:ADP-ribosylation factor-like protein 13B [Geranomyces variabilis]|uniref:ADP-ribosylation factor-like protein 13B n=1 Tax=Geranomyces variabilis TaxID=109894 RepID=A0AAD5XP54_9FUNG|nr:ADP-ribosylation factor-like protein 13B [Geranomyces variabilis]
MSSCFSCFGGGRKSSKKLVILVLGVDGAGKTTVLLRLKGDGASAKRTSWGFTTATLAHEVPPAASAKAKKVKTEKVDATYYDVGGDSKIRGIWKNYYAEACACIYVVDSANRERIAEAAEVLAEIYGHERMKDKPLIVLANKQDLPQAMSADELREALKIEELRARQTSLVANNDDEQSWWVQVLPCTTNVNEDSKTVSQDFLKVSEIPSLLRAVLDRFHRIGPRCAADTQQQKKAWDIDREEQKKRVEEYRAEKGQEDASGSVADVERKVIASQEMEETGGDTTKKSGTALFSRSKSGNTVHPEPLPEGKVLTLSKDQLRPVDPEAPSGAKRTNTVHPEAAEVQPGSASTGLSTSKNALRINDAAGAGSAGNVDLSLTGHAADAAPSTEATSGQVAASSSQEQLASHQISTTTSDDNPKPTSLDATSADSPVTPDPLSSRPLPSRLNSNTSSLTGKISKRGILAPLDSSELHHPLDHHSLPPLGAASLPPLTLHQAPWVRGPLGNPKGSSDL